MEKEVCASIIKYFRSFGKLVDEDTNLFEADIIDSMGLIELVVFIEAEFGIPIDQEDLKIQNFKTIRSVANIIKARRQT